MNGSTSENCVLALDPIAALLSSESACTAVAAREIRKRDRNLVQTLQHVLARIRPVIARMAQGKRATGGTLRPLVQSLSQSLRERENMIRVETIVERGPPSSNESYLIETIQAEPRDKHRTLEFVATRLRVTRREIEIIHQSTDFTINAHVLSRYMQRERKPVETFYENVMRPLKLAHVFGAYTVARNPRDIILPFSTGVLLGETNVVDSTETGVAFRVNTKDGIQKPDFVDNAMIQGKYRAAYDIRTFVDWDALHPDKVAMMEILKEFEAEYEQEIDGIYRIMVFGSERGDIERYKLCIGRAKQIVDSPEWEAMLQHRRRSVGYA